MIWFFIDFLFIYQSRGYFFKMGVEESIVRLLRDVFFGSTFPGSWFLSALVVSVVLVYISSKYFGRVVTFILALSISLYVAYHSSLPDSWQIPYKWYAATFRDEVNLSFPFALVWVSMGEWLACEKTYEKWSRFGSRRIWVLALSTVAFYVWWVFVDGRIVNYFFVVSLFMLAVCLNMDNKPVYKNMRDSSILFFLFHFSIAGKKGLFLNLVGSNEAIHHIAYYFIVLAICFAFAFSALWLEKKKPFHFLKYIH